MTTPAEPPKDASAAGSPEDSAPEAADDEAGGEAGVPAGKTAGTGEGAGAPDTADSAGTAGTAGTAEGPDAEEEPGTGPGTAEQKPFGADEDEAVSTSEAEAAGDAQAEPESEPDAASGTEAVSASTPEADADTDTDTVKPAEDSAEASAAPGSDAAVPDADPDAGTDTAATAGGSPAPRRRFKWLKALAISTSVLVLAGAGGIWYVYQHLNGNITTDTVTENELKAQASQRPPEGPASTENILLIGSDSRSGGNDKYGQDTGTQRSDTTILLHLSADRTNATAVSIPRDLMVHVPTCTKSDGSTISPKFEQFNWAFEFGGAACTIRAVEELTGVRVDHHLIVDFSGFKSMVDAVGGVEVCTPEAIHDTDSHLDLSAGKHKLDGEQALGYVRVRHGIGDGSDTERIGRQQDFLASLIKKVQSNGVLLNPGKVYPLLNAATKSLTADPGLDSLSDLYSLAQRLQKIPAGAIHFVTAPVEPYVADHNRDQLVQPDAESLFAAVRADQQVRVSSGDDSSSSSKDSGGSGGSDSASPSPSDTSPSDTPDPTATGSPSGTPSGSSSATPSDTPSGTPTFKGTTADRDVCG
ncbi:LCP family protein [Actinacidiphila reveromycinica]|uniref:LCP family protein n=1 Tax=Actinacidiphila reveromycinica TaxID=659352 RepID=UPI001F2A87F9|nr:LCP family protein [Streptomyces sp. SN-593]